MCVRASKRAYAHTLFDTKVDLFLFSFIISLSFSSFHWHPEWMQKTGIIWVDVCCASISKLKKNDFDEKQLMIFSSVFEEKGKKRRNFSPYTGSKCVLRAACMQMHVPNRIFGIMWIIILRRICRRKTRILFIVEMCAQKRQSQPVQIDKFYTFASVCVCFLIVFFWELRFKLLRNTHTEKTW